MRLALIDQPDFDLTSGIFTEARPMNELEYLALGETLERIELFDGCLHLSPNPSVHHQFVFGQLSRTLLHAADQVGLPAVGAVNVRLRPDRIAIPDFVITTPDIDMQALVNDASEVRLIGEIVSPTSAAIDEVLKMHYYAAAGIPWYLLVEEESGTLRLHKLDGATYTEHAVAEVGGVLRLTDPVVVTIDPAQLLPPG